MKYLIFYLSISINIPISTFYDIITDNKSRCYISIDVKLGNNISTVVVPNDELYLYFAETKSFDKTQYRSFIMKILKQKLIVPIDSNELTKYGFVKINGNKNVSKYFKMGQAAFIQHYFSETKGVKLKIAKAIPDDEFADVINYLFYWQIPTAIDDETGFPIICN